MTSRTSGIELGAGSPTGLVAPGNHSQQLSRALHNLFLQRSRVDTSLTILPQFDLVLLCVTTHWVGGHAQQIVDPLIVDFEIADSQKKLARRCLPDVGKDVGNGQRDHTRI